MIALLSLWLTPDEHREANGFTLEPIREVAKLFAGIFICIIPVLAMLQAGRTAPSPRCSPPSPPATALPHDAAYFWLTGILSAFLDNAPTYLVFFELAGGDAPNLMGRSPARSRRSRWARSSWARSPISATRRTSWSTRSPTERGVAMPSFFGYLFWAALVLVPLFLLLTLLPVSPLSPVES